jgi:hypothetical protein
MNRIRPRHPRLRECSVVVQQWNLLLLRSFSHDTGSGLTSILMLASSLLAVDIVLLSDLRSPVSALRRIRIKPSATIPTNLPALRRVANFHLRPRYRLLFV